LQRDDCTKLEFDFTPTLKLWLRTNAEPQFDGADTGMIRRIKKVPFVHVLPESIRDRSLPERLRQEAAGILNWTLAGLKDYQENGLLEPAVVKEQTAEYISSLDIIGQFIDERCDVGAYTVKASTLYQEYSGWMPNSKYAVSEGRFKSDLVGRGFTHKHTNVGNVWAGIRLTQFLPMATTECCIEA
jgi:putative DNA primase/helicase